jgi:hypothetical protein
MNRKPMCAGRMCQCIANPADLSPLLLTHSAIRISAVVKKPNPVDRKAVYAGYRWLGPIGLSADVSTALLLLQLSGGPKAGSGVSHIRGPGYKVTL